MKKALIAIIVIMVASVFVLNTMMAPKAAKLPLVPPLTEQELTDFYKKALAYDSIVPKRDSVQSSYELNDVDEGTKRKLLQAQSIVEKQLFSHNYVPGSVLSESQQYYIKAVIDDKQLIRNSVEKVAKTLDFYIVDVKYDIRPKSPGTFLEGVEYLGIHGAFKQSGNEDYLDTGFLNTANNKVWQHLTRNQKTNMINLETENAQVAYEQIGSENIPSDYGLEGRTPKKDVKLFNEVMGSSLTNTAYMPQLSMVFTPSGEEDTISGYGIYPEGNAGMKLFGFNRSSLKGTMTLRYLFKGSLNDLTKVEAVAVYPVSMNIDFEPEDSNVIVSDLVMTEISKIVDRYDRALSNNDITALMSGDIVRDIGIAVRNGFMQNYSHLSRHISKVESILNKKGNYYLVQVESLVQEGPKGKQLYGTYKDKSLFVIQQMGTSFVINDILKIKRQLIEEPKLELDDSIRRHLTALNLQGTISEESKNGIRQLLSNLYEASTQRILKGMYDCFNDDVNILPSSKREYFNSQLRGWLIKHGVETKSVYMGRVSEWLGGSDNQAELITEELIEYIGKDSGQYMKMYYLVSNFNGKWVIDDMKVISVEDVKGEALQSVKQKLSQ